MMKRMISSVGGCRKGCVFLLSSLLQGRVASQADLLQTREHRPTPEVARLLGEANVAYAVHGAAEALEIYLQVVRHDQYIAQAWSSLASCYDELGKGEAARQMRFFAAHVDRDGEKWAILAGEFK